MPEEDTARYFASMAALRAPNVKVAPPDSSRMDVLSARGFKPLRHARRKRGLTTASSKKPNQAKVRIIMDKYPHGHRAESR